jgi:Co/Zn/Cd efflux system component
MISRRTWPERHDHENAREAAELDRVRIWSITEDVVAFSAEVVLKEMGERRGAEETGDRLADGLKARFGFAETTLQISGVEGNGM